MLNNPYLTFKQQLKIFKELHINWNNNQTVTNMAIQQTNVPNVLSTFRESRHLTRTNFYKKKLPGLQKGSW